MTQNTYTIRQANQAEVEIMAEWAAQEGWNPGLNDAQAFYACDPNGFFIGYLGEEPIACISAVSYGSTFSFIGFYIVKDGFRGKGYGIKIWEHAMAHLSSNQNIGLDGVVAQQENYKKSGFVWAYSNIRYELSISKPNLPSSSSQILQIQESDLEVISNYDLQIFGHQRKTFLQSWLMPENGKALYSIDNQSVKGYGVIRKCRAGYKIGPLFSESEKIAEDLFLALLDYTEADQKVYLDVPEVNLQAVQLAEKYGGEKSFETARMYTNLQRDYPIEKVFGVSTFELG